MARNLFLWSVDESGYRESLADFLSRDGEIDVAGLHATAVRLMLSTDVAISEYIDVVGLPLWDPESRASVLNAPPSALLVDIYCAVACAPYLTIIPYREDAGDIWAVMDRIEPTGAAANRRILGRPFEELVRAAAGDTLAFACAQGEETGLGWWMDPTQIQICLDGLTRDRDRWYSPSDDLINALDVRRRPDQAPAALARAYEAYRGALQTAAATGLGLRTALLM